MNYNTDDIFWKYIKESGKNCDKINEVRKKYKKKYGPEKIKLIDELFNKYYSMIWAKLEPSFGTIYDEDSNGFREFIFYLLSKGKNKMDLFLEKDYDLNYFKDISKFNVEYKIEKKLFEERSPYQLVQVFETKDFGNMLVIDNDVQLTESDEENYHEMIAHVPINYFNKDINVLIIGGGDGGTAREVLKHNNVKNLIMVDIDEIVVKAAKLHFPNFRETFNNPRLNLKIADGFEYVKNYKGDKFDVVIIDSTDFNQSIPLFTPEFYENIKKIVNEKYMICFNADNINWNENNIVKIVKQQRTLFDYVNPFGVYIPTFAGGFYSFCLASNTIDPIKSKIDWDYYKAKQLNLEYYTRDIHKSSFSMPKSLENKLEKFKHVKENKYKSKGVHYIININSLDFELLNNEKKLDAIFIEGIKKGNMTLLEKKIHQFKPQGLTGFYLLAESHCSFHTWPEEGFITIDLFSCGNPLLTKESVKYIINSFDSKDYTFKKINR